MQEESQNLTLVSAVIASVDKDTMTSITREIPAHEVDVLKAVFGKDNVRQERAAAPVALDLDKEFERLSAKYGPAAVEDAIGKEGAVRRAALAFEVKGPVQIQPLSGGDAGGDEAPEAMSVADLKTELTARGVEFKGNASKETLVALVSEARALETQ